MSLQERLRQAIKAAARKFNRTIDSYEPTFDANPYPERLVTYYYVQALANALGSGSVLLEVPVTGSSGKRRDNHIDALVFSEHDLVLAEFKRAWTPSHWKLLAADLKRLQELAGREVRGRFRHGPQRRAWLLLGSDCWREAVANVWKSGSAAKGWAVPTPFLRADRDYVTVYRENGQDYDGYYLTWALVRLGESGSA